MSIIFSLVLPIVFPSYDEYRSVPDVPAAIMVREYEDGKVEVFHLDKLPDGNEDATDLSPKIVLNQNAESGEYMESVGAYWGFFPAVFGGIIGYTAAKRHHHHAPVYRPSTYYWNEQRFFYNYNGWQHSYAFQYRVTPVRFAAPCNVYYFY